MGITIKEIEKVIDIGKEYGAKRLILFGSAREHPENARDLDLGCDGIEGWKLYEFGARLEEELNILVDIIPLSPSTHFSEYISSKGKVLL